MANDGFIEFLSPNALSELKQAETLVNNLASSIEKINKFKAPISPSAADNAIKQQIADLKAQEQAIKKVSDIQRQIETNAKNQTSANQKLTKSEYDYVKSVERAIVAKEKAAKAAEREALGNEKLYSAYNELNAARTRAKNTLRDLIASQAASNSEIKKAQREFDNLDQKVRKADKAVGDFSKSVGNYKGALSGIGNLMGAFGISTGLYLAADLIKNIYETTKQLQSMDLALKMVSGSQDEFAKNQLFLTDLADQYGIEIKGLTKNFTEFWVASKGKLEAEKIKEIFTSISKSVAVMGLSVEQQDSAFLALQQMMSKGTVQAEELKKQLGNALPGAVKAATMAYQALHPELKVTEKIFMEQMKAGKILSAELLPELAKAYEKLYGIETVKRAETLAAAQNRLSNSWTTFIRSINESNSGALSTFFSLGTQAATGFLMILTRINDSWDTIYKKAEAKGTIDASNTFRNLMGSKEGEDAIKQAEQNIRIATSALDTTVEQLDELETQLKNINPWALNFFGPSPKDIKLQIEALKQQKAEYEGLLNLSKEFLKNQKKPAPKPVIADAGIGGKTKRKPDEKQINIQDKLLKNEYDLRIRELEIAKKVQEEIFNNEDKSYAERLAARDKFSKLSLQLLDLKNNREIEIEKDKANQLLKNQKEARDKDLKANAENVKNGFANKKVEIENRYAENVKTINYNLAQELLKININYLEETRDLQNVDLAFFKKIQEEKEKLTKETADIYFQMAQERRLKDSNDENRSLTQRQASFEAWKSMAEAQLFFDEALAKSNSNQSPEQIAKITAEFDKLRN
jgi:tape measure domain-containing protein